MHASRAQAAARTTDALNLTALPRRVSAAEIDDYSVAPAHEPGGRRGWQVRLEGLLPLPHVPSACVQHHPCMRSARSCKLVSTAGHLMTRRHIKTHTRQVSGVALERFAAMTNWDYYEASLRFQKVLEVAGAL